MRFVSFCKRKNTVISVTVVSKRHGNLELKLMFRWLIFPQNTISLEAVKFRNYREIKSLAWYNNLKLLSFLRNIYFNIECILRFYVCCWQWVHRLSLRCNEIWYSKKIFRITGTLPVLLVSSNMHTELETFYLTRIANYRKYRYTLKWSLYLKDNTADEIMNASIIAYCNSAKLTLYLNVDRYLYLPN